MTKLTDDQVRGIANLCENPFLEALRLAGFTLMPMIPTPEMLTVLRWINPNASNAKLRRIYDDLIAAYDKEVGDG